LSFLLGFPHLVKDDLALRYLIPEMLPHVGISDDVIEVDLADIHLELREGDHLGNFSSFGLGKLRMFFSIVFERPLFSKKSLVLGKHLDRRRLPLPQDV
jgi:hypothetical protein